VADRNLYHLLIRRGLDAPAKTVLETDRGERWSAVDLDRESARVAHFLVGLGLVPGDRVAVQIDKSVQSLLLYLACLRAGLVYLPLNTAYQPAEVGYFLSDAEPRAIVCRSGSLDDTRQLARTCGALHVYTVDADGSGTLFQACASAPAEFATIDRGDDDLAVIVYTSGTTGRSKGAMLSHGNLTSNALALHDYWGFRPDDVLLHTLPMFHVHGLFVANHLGLLSGATLLFHPRFDVAGVLRDLRRATVFMGVPTYYTRLLAEPAFGRDSGPGMRLYVSGSAPLLAETFREFAQRTGHTILERYGMTETGMNTSNPLNGERRPGSVGLPLPGVEARVVDDGDTVLPPGAIGHIQVRGPNVFSGYWRRPDKNAEEFTADRFFRTGDMGEFSADGYLSIVGRAKDLIISGGYNVYPKEIELCLDDLPGVAESAVFGVPHPDFGEAVTAAVVLKPGTAGIAESDVIARLRTQLANYKIPKRVHFVPELPRNTMGKVQKNVLRSRWSDTGGA
jgi:malonyl-CoA/methylmalonyl-CoA synthetase